MAGGTVGPVTVKPFNMLRYFAVASLGLMAFFCVVTAEVLSENLERNLTEEAGLYAEDLSRSVNRSLSRELLAPLKRAGSAFDPSDPDQLSSMDRIVADRTRGFRILDMILFDPEGKVVYSTHPEDVGLRSLHNPGITSALEGNASTFLAEHELEVEELRSGTDLVETYTPFFVPVDADSGQEVISGVLEIYQDGRPIRANIVAGRREIGITTTGLVLILFAALFSVVQRGDRRIRDLTQELSATNRALERRVQERTGEIEAARLRLQALLDAITDGITVIDSSFQVVASNPGIERLFGPAKSAEPVPCYVRHAGRSQPCEGCPAATTLAYGRRAERRYRWPGESGRMLDVEVTTFPFMTPQGDPGAIELVRDVSERVMLERQVAQAETLAKLGEMAAGVAHEIRNPIGMIASSAQLLAQADGLAERDRELLGVMLVESARINLTISEFVNFATPPKPCKALTDPGALLERVRSVLRPEVEKRGAVITVEQEAGVPDLMVDAEMLYRALTNLVLNALQVGAAHVKLAAQCENEGVALLVCDDGPGISADHLPRIFEPFFTRRAGGTGLGLSVVQRTVVENGGRIQVTSTEGRTMFRLLFDRIEA